MTITQIIKHYESYLEGQVHAALSMRQLVVIDRNIAESAFHISQQDILTFQRVLPDTTTLCARKNSQLFKITIPAKAELLQSIKRPAIYEVPFSNLKVKSCITNYCIAQRQCLLSIKSAFDLDCDVTKALFNLGNGELHYFHEHSAFDISRLSDRYTWILSLNYESIDNVFFETAERAALDSNFMESSLLY